MGKPLISDAALRGMYETMKTLRTARLTPEWAADLPREQRSALREEPESLLAAVLSQLHRRDTILTEGRNPLLQAGLKAAFADAPAPASASFPGSAEECAAAAAGIALKQKLGSYRPGRHPVVIGLLRSQPALGGTLRLMNEQQPSLILIISGGEPLSRLDAQRSQRHTAVPHLLVDSSDAVAVCRVLQESVLRARSGWGGVVIHATAMPGAAEPMHLVKEHLRNRGLDQAALQSIPAAGHGL